MLSSARSSADETDALQVSAVEAAAPHKSAAERSASASFGRTWSAMCLDQKSGRVRDLPVAASPHVHWPPKPACQAERRDYDPTPSDPQGGVSPHGALPPPRPQQVLEVQLVIHHRTTNGSNKGTVAKHARTTTTGKYPANMPRALLRHRSRSQRPSPTGSSTVMFGLSRPGSLDVLWHINGTQA